ncbi:MAG TPA: sulfatase [Blastocatellia bacterium]|nr:sulfatase [Blastocatellia bacterium]
MDIEKANNGMPQETDRPLTAQREKIELSAVLQKSAKLLLIAVWFGLLTGLAEFSLLGTAKYFMNRYISYFGRDFVWMAPLAEVLLFAIAALILLLPSLLWPRLITLRVAIFLFAFLGFINLLLIYQRLHIFATLALAVGLATQTSRFLGAHIEGFYRIVRRTTVWIVVLIAALGIGIRGWQSMAEQRALANLPPARPDAPNVLLIVLDTVRARNLSLYGYHRPTTPGLEKLAKKGVVFERAISTAPWTLPSHASMFTGRNQYELSVGFASKLDAAYPTLAEVLSANGYMTAGFVANTWYAGKASGLDRGFIRYEDMVVSPGQIIVSSTLGRTANNNFKLRRAIGYSEVLGRKTAPDINDSFLRWLSERDPQRPFFAFLNYFDAHEPYLPPEPFDTKFDPNEPRGNPRHDHYWNWTPAEVQAEMDAYDEAISYLDHHVGLLFDQLEKRGLLDNTLVIITSDHGEEFYEHEIMDHGYSLYMPLLRVPLLISFPDRVPAGMRVKEPVTPRYLAATVMELLKLKNEAGFPGVPLSRFWDGGTAPESSVTQPLLSELEFTPNLPESYPISQGEMKSLITDRYQYIKNGDGSEELYDYLKDPLQQRNLHLSKEGRTALAKFRTSLASIFSRHQMLRVSRVIK